MSQVECVISGAVLPKDLAGIQGLETGFQPSPVSQSRLLVSGPPGSGKSTFLNSNSALIMLDEEKGGKTVANPLAMRYTVPAHVPMGARDKAYLDFVDTIVARRIAGKTDIEMVGIDSYNEMVETFVKAACARESVEDIGLVGGGHGRGYAQVRESINGMLDKIHKAGLGWAIIVHSAIDKETQTSYLDIFPSFVGPIHRKCEHSLWVEDGIERVPQPPIKKTIKGKVIETTQPDLEVAGRFLLSAPGGVWNSARVSDLKARLPLPESIRLPRIGGWQAFTAAYNEAVINLIGGKYDGKEGN